jgi:hypothetical protein
MSTHPVEPEPLPPQPQPSNPNPTHLPVEPEFGMPVQPVKPEEPGVPEPNI